MGAFIGREVKVLLLVLDGLADTTHEELGWRTPLQAARTKTLDFLASGGAQGLLYPLGPGTCPSSEVAHWAIFGYDPPSFPGRTYLHALHHGIGVSRDEALFTANVVRIVPGAEGPLKGGIVKLGSDRMEAFVAAWNRLLPPGVRAVFMDEDDILLAVEKGSRMVVTSDPFLVGHPLRRISPRAGWEDNPSARRTARLVSQAMLAGEDALREAGLNPERLSGEALGLVIKWPSRALPPEPWSRRHGMEAGAVVSTPCFSGMAAALGMKVRWSGSEEPGEDLSLKLLEARGLFEEGCDFVFVHTKHADEAAHTGRPSLKVEVIEAMDQALAESDLLDRDDLLWVITCDHPTPSLGDGRVIHGGDPVPVLFHGGLTRRDLVDRFDEVSAASGGYGRLEGREVMELARYLSFRAGYFTG
jgi:2,3-bisphosphoglycerate-independent phosphoglycerate mutase